MTRLVRTQVGPFELGDANEQLITPWQAFEALNIERIVVNDEIAARMVNGAHLSELISGTADTLAVFTNQQQFVAVVERIDGEWRYGFVERDYLTSHP